MAEAPSAVEFFSRVLVWDSPETPGFCHIAWRNPKFEHGFSGKAYTRLVDFMAGRDWLVAHPSVAKEIWFATGQQREAGDSDKNRALRSRANTAMMKSIFLDIDVKEGGYVSIPEALDALTAFCKTVQIPYPSAIVASGSGLQPYWISDRPLSVEEWQSYADGLRALAVSHGLRCDGGVTIDCARVLRIPGTINNKTDPGRPVKLLRLAKEDLKFDAKLAHIRGTYNPVVHAEGGAKTAKHNWVAALEPETPDADLKAAAPLATAPESPPVSLIPVIHECPYFKNAFATGGKGADQGLWMMTVLATTFAKDGQKFAHELSKGHKTYSPADTDAMYERKDREKEERSLGWPSCSTFEQYGSKQCAACPWHGRIKSPLNLHLTPSKPPAPPPPAASFPAAAPPAPARADPPGRQLFVPPKPYFLSPEGHISCVANIKGKKQPEKVRLFRQKIYDVRTERDVGTYFTVEEDLGNFKEVFIKRGELGAKTAKTLSEAAVNYSPQHVGEVAEFMSSFMEKIWAVAAADQAPPYGWAWNDNKLIGWACTGVLYKADGTTLAAGHADPVRAKYYTPCGDEAPWFEVLNLVTRQHRPALEAIVAASFGTPLLEFTGAPSGCIAGVSDTASNKTTACNAGLAVWGQPTMTKIASSASILGTQGKMTELKDLPTYCDDVRTDNDGLIAVTRLIRTCMEASQGDKLTQTGEARERGQWKSILIITSNKSVVEQFVVEAPDNAAGLMRIFEFKVPHYADDTPGRIEFPDADIMQKKLDRNYGRIGQRYSKMLAEYAAWLPEFVQAMEKDLAKEVGAKGEERFWVSTIACIMCGAMLANRLGATFHIDELHDFLVQAYADARTKVVEKAVGTSSEANTTNMLTSFFKARPDSAMYTTTYARQGTKQSGGWFLHGPEIGRAVHIHWVVSEKICRISRDEFEKHCRENNASADAALDGLKKHYGMLKYDRANLASGTQYSGSGRESLIILPVMQPWMEEILYQRSAIRSGQLTVVGAPSGTVSSMPGPSGDRSTGDPPHL